VQEVSVRPHLLQREQIATLMVYACHAIANKLLGDVCKPFAVALQRLLRGIGRPFTGLVERGPRPVGNPSVEVTVRVAVIGPAGRVGRALVDVRHFERLTVVERGVAAAMMHLDRVVLRHLVQVVNVEQAIVFHLGVVEEIAFDPGARRCLGSFRAKFGDDTVNRHKLDHVGIADDDVVKQYVAGRMIVAVDEPGHDGHLFGVECLGPFAGERLHPCGGPHGGEPAGLDRERLHPRRAGIDCVDLGIEDKEISVVPFVSRCGAWPCPADKSRDASSGQVHEPSAATLVIHHRLSSPNLCPSQRAENNTEGPGIFI
jgi:hypothetical protein